MNNGSTIGYFEAFQPSMETKIIHGGKQSAPLFYDNTNLIQAERQELSPLGIDLSNITTLTVGLEKTGATGGSVMIFPDDIRLYRSKQTDK